jgi:hypothetical protein
VRSAWLDEDGEHYFCISEKTRKELLVQLFMLLQIGGGLNQYEDEVGPYRECLKELYKDVVSIRKDASTGHVFLDSFAYKINKIQVKYFAKNL